jgi:hypothetical protein
MLKAMPGTLLATPSAEGRARDCDPLNVNCGNGHNTPLKRLQMSTIDEFYILVVDRNQPIETFTGVRP